MRDLVIVGTVGLVLIAALMVSTSGDAVPKMQTVFEFVEHYKSERRQAAQDRATETRCDAYWLARDREHLAAANSRQ